MKCPTLLASWMLALLATTATAQTTAPATMPLPTATPKIDLPGPPPPLDPDVVPTLKILQDRPTTLKDFTGKIDYSVHSAITDDTNGKRGTIDFLADRTLGAQFTADFTEDTSAGVPTAKHHQQVIFDGRVLTVKDFQAKAFSRSDITPPGGKPGAALTLNGAMPLPIGLQVDDVARNFTVTRLPSADANLTVLRLVPLPQVKSKFDFKQLDITVDNKLQLPVKMIETNTNKEETTIVLKDLSVNADRAKMQDPSIPADWHEMGK